MLFGGKFDKLRWLTAIDFDLLIIDEAHEGVETDKADFAIERIRHKHRLHLSGTPFKQLARGAFRPEQTFTWSYVDEQEAKANWKGEANNPYEELPRLEMFTYALSPMVEAAVRKGFDAEHKYAFDLLEFFATDGKGRFTRVADVLAIPWREKCREVVRNGFMCDFLFQNVGTLFRNPGAYAAILNKMPEAKDFQGTRFAEEAIDLDGVPVDKAGNATVPEETVVGTAKELFGDKLYGEEVVMPPLAVGEPDAPEAEVDFVGAVMEQVQPTIVEVATQGLPKSARKRVARQVEQGLREAVEGAKRANRHAVADAENAHAAAMAAAPDEATRERLAQEHAQVLANLERKGQEKVEAAIRDYVNDLPERTTGLALTAQAEAAKETAEDRIRDRLRGFARTIPSFLMAYGDDTLTLANFDKKVEAEPFQELTGITLDDFRLLRDGGERDGETLEGHVFDETVFNDSIKAFLEKKRTLCNWFDNTQKEDIFDYIPQQKTNQVFTPRAVVVRMVDALERENPGCFDNPEHTFADLYVKSGLFLAEIAKRLYRNPAMKAAFPDDKARLGHIFTRQLYAMAPTRIIHKIVLNYLLGFDPDLRARAEGHIVQVDAAEAAQAGKLGTEVAEHFV